MYQFYTSVFHVSIRVHVGFIIMQVSTGHCPQSTPQRNGAIDLCKVKKVQRSIVLEIVILPISVRTVFRVNSTRKCMS